MNIPKIDRDLLSGAWKSLVSLFIKVATAGLSYLMFVVLSRTMEDAPYGLFASGFALATVLSIAAAFGQQTAVLRFWPEEDVAGRPQGALNAIRSGWAIVIVCSIAVALGLSLIAFVTGLIVQDFASVAYLFAAALLVLPMAGADFSSSALRAQGSVWTALMPRDIIWRGSVSAIVWVLFLYQVQLDGFSALMLTALLLIASVGLQFIASRLTGYQNSIGFRGLPTYWRKHKNSSKWYFAGSLVESIALNADIILVGLLVAEAAAGLYFNAFRSAALITLFMFAIELVAAPLIARHYHAKEMHKARLVATFNVWAGFLFSLVVFVIFVFYGDLVLSLFGASYVEGYWILIILSVGLLFDALTGPSRIVMMMTGFERDYVRISGIFILLAVLLQLYVIPNYGLIGAALVNAGTRIAARICLAWWARTKIGIDTSVLGLFDLLFRKDAVEKDRA